MEIIKILSLTLLMSIFCAGTSFSQQDSQQIQKSQKARMTSGERATKHAKKLKKTLNLTSGQLVKLQAAQMQFAKDRKQIREENHRKMKEQREAYDAQLKIILTPEQYKKMQNQHKKIRKEKSGKWNKAEKKYVDRKKCDKKRKPGKCGKKRG